MTCVMKVSRFIELELGPPIEAIEVNKQFCEDSFCNKVNLASSAYRDDKGEPWVLPVVRKVEKELLLHPSSHRYGDATLDGIDEFNRAATTLLLGEECLDASDRAFSVQSLSGIGGMRIAAEFLHTQLGYNTFYYAEPTWDCHHLVFVNSGMNNPRTYRYWHNQRREIDFDGLIEDLRHAEENSVIILQAAGHNPTGLDPTQEQWEKIADVMENQKLFPFFESTYQGFASGDVERDAWAVRYFVKRGFELICAQCFATNFGLYDEHVGALTVVVKEPTCLEAIKSQLELNIYALYGSHSLHGTLIVSAILNNATLFAEWKEQLKEMTNRMSEMRSTFVSELNSLNVVGNWDRLTRHSGLFSYTGLTRRQVEHLLQDYHIYLLKNSRMSFSGLTRENVQFVAKAFHDAIHKFPQQQELYTDII